MQFPPIILGSSPFHLVSIPQAVWIACNSSMTSKTIHTAVFQYRKRYGLHAIEGRKGIFLLDFKGFQYRKRYGLHAMKQIRLRGFEEHPFQYRKRYGLHAMKPRSVMTSQPLEFQYRKRYGLHAIPSLTALGTAKPRSGFSKRNALLGKSPQTRGIFLSPKTAENVRKPCNIKETFVHGKSMKLMAFSPKSLPSL